MDAGGGFKVEIEEKNRTQRQSMSNNKLVE